MMNGILENIRYADMVATANAAVDFVAIGSGTGIAQPFTDSAGKRFFQNGDNVQVESATLKLPYCFGAADSPFFFIMGACDPTLIGPAPLAQFGLGGAWWFSTPQWEFENPVWIPQPAALVGAKWALMAMVSAGARISMINCPAALDGDSLLPQLWLKIRHTLPMIA